LGLGDLKVYKIIYKPSINALTKPKCSYKLASSMIHWHMHIILYLTEI